MSQRNLPPATDASSSVSLSRRGLLAATAAAIPAGAVLLSSAPALADPTVTDGETRIVDVPLSEAPLVDVDGHQVRDLPEQPATMVGVTWPDELDAPEVLVRGLDGEGEWTEWLPLDTAEDPETGESVAGTEAGWVGVVTALQIRAELDGGDATEQLVAHVVTTSPTSADEQVLTLEDAGMTGTASTQDAAPQMRTMAASATVNPRTPRLPAGSPSFTSRAQWGADESLVRSTRGADELKAVIIHHTAGTNSYSSSESAQIVRGIFRYHTVSLGWADIGYNILVSKYGQVFEGRSGGLHRNIVGAHSYGFNTGSFGISVMGDYSSSAPPSVAQRAVAALVGWKLLSTFQTRVWGTSSWTPGSGTRFTEGRTISLAKMMGHRDVNYTKCPGLSLYHRFDSIRGLAQDAIDSGDKRHLQAFHDAGGASALGSVVKSNHLTGSYWATILTEGLVLESGGGAPRGDATPYAPQWRSGWGRPTGSAFTAGGQDLQTFQNGAVVVQRGDVIFHDSRFIDVPPAMKFRAEIEQLASREITRGWPDGTFRPLAENQRDAMIVFLYRALGSPSFRPPATSPFTDMPPTRQFYKEITWAYKKGITTGWPDGTFRPTSSVERGAVAAFLYRASGATSTSTSNSFKDVPSSHQFAKEITWLEKTGITTGWPDGTFRSTEPITRDAMAAFMIRWMKYRGL